MSDPAIPTPTTPTPTKADPDPADSGVEVAIEEVKTKAESTFAKLVKKFGLPVAIVIVAVGAFVFLHLL
jgi:hypothetical protein